MEISVEKGVLLMKKIVFMFPGVGSQYVGMGKEFYDSYNVVRETFAEASDVLKKDFSGLCFSDSSKDELKELGNAQLALVVLSVATYRVYMQEIGVPPQYCMGHSLGEYSALCCAGVIRFPDVLRLIKERGSIIKNVAVSLDGTMMWVINIDVQTVGKICKEFSREGEEVFVSAYDSPSQLSISGQNGSVMKAARKLEENGALVYPLKLSGPFHCPLMRRAAEEMRAVLQQYNYYPPVYPVIANRNAQLYSDPQKVIDNLSLQLISPVRWQASILYLLSQEVEMAIEMGPKDVLKFLLEKNSDAIRTFTLDNNDDLNNLKEELVMGQDEFLPLIGRVLGVATSTRNYNDNSEEYREKVVGPYRRIEAIYKKLSSNGQTPTVEQAAHAVATLRSILQSKKVPQHEQQRRIEHVLKRKILKSSRDIVGNP